MNPPPRFALVAGELSGDLLGAGLIRALRARYPGAEFEGIGGPAMLAEGLVSHYPLSWLSVMGLVEVLAHYPRLKRCHTALGNHFLRHPPDVFIGLDAPDFNLPLEARLKNAGIKTAHYVSPSVWAWRAYRLKKIARACDLMLTLFPFEAAYYHRHQIAVRYVGHPLADHLPLEVDQAAARRLLELPEDGQWLALLPGSRRAEVRRLTPPFLDTARWLRERCPELNLIVPLANEEIRQVFQDLQTRHAPDLPITRVDGQGREVMAAADAVLLASGTATLEAMLLKRPMVVGYRLAPATYFLARRLVKTPFFALPNLLGGRLLVPEYLQEAATPEHLGPPLLDWLRQPAAFQPLRETFEQLHRELRRDADEQAARAVAELREGKEP